MKTLLRLMGLILILIPATLPAQSDSIRLACPLDEAVVVPPPKNAIHYDPPDLCVVLMSKPDTTVKAVINARVTNVEVDKGYASYQDLGEGVFKLHKIYVLPDQQGKGTGRFMIEHIIAQVKNNNGTRLQLQVNKGNKAKSFYEKLGFAVVRDFVLEIGNG